MKMNKTKIFRLWLRNLINWLLVPKTVYSVVLIIISGILFSFVIPRILGSCNIPYIKSLDASLTLQIMGTLCVGKEIFTRTRSFDQQGYLNKIVTWFKKFPLPKQPVIHSAVAIGGARSGGRAYGEVIAKSKVNPTLEEKIENLEERLNQQTKRIDELTKTTKHKFNTTIDLITKHKTECDSIFESIKIHIDKLVFGSINLEIIGFSWLIAGLLLR